MSERVLIPADVPDAQAIVRRLCELQRAVVDVIDPNGEHPHDCFCGESGFWPLSSPAGFSNDGLAVDYIEAVVRWALKMHPAMVKVAADLVTWHEDATSSLSGVAGTEPR